MGGFTPRLIRVTKYSLLGGTVLPYVGLGQHVSSRVGIGAFTVHYQEVGMLGWLVNSRGAVSVIL